MLVPLDAVPEPDVPLEEVPVPELPVLFEELLVPLEEVPVPLEEDPVAEVLLPFAELLVLELPVPLDGFLDPFVAASPPLPLSQPRHSRPTKGIETDSPTSFRRITQIDLS